MNKTNNKFAHDYARDNNTTLSGLADLWLDNKLEFSSVDEQVEFEEIAVGYIFVCRALLRLEKTIKAIK